MLLRMYQTQGFANRLIIANYLKGQCHEKSFVRLVLISVKHGIKIGRQSIFSFLITCLVLQIFTVLKYANSL